MTEHAPGGAHDRGQDFWDQRYREAPTIWSGQPNPQLVAQASDLAPGAALDIGAGEGADAVWLAQRGWTVTAVDLSPVALDRAAAHAEAVGVAGITWQQADVTTWSPPQHCFDLVSVHFLHLPSATRRVVYAGLAAAVAPGGSLLIVGHHPLDLGTTARRPSDPDLLFTHDELIQELSADEWEVLVGEACPRRTTDAEGETITLHDAVLHARRR